MKKKLIIVSVALVLVVCFAVGMTIAYLTSTPGPVTNTFTVGKVEITLDETDVDEYGAAVSGADRVTANEYLLIPGHNYTKDPTVHVQPGSEACYVFVKVEDGLAAIEADTTIAAQIAANGWTELETGVYYKTQAKVASDASAVDLTVFGSFTLKTDADVSGYADAQIKITAYAIQQDGLTVAQAWAALNPTNP